MTIPPVQFGGLISLEEKVLALPQCLQKPREKKVTTTCPLGGRWRLTLSHARPVAKCLKGSSQGIFHC